MLPRYDLVVVGAGPAGSTLARLVAARGHSVLLLEKDREVGLPVRCGEAVSNRSLEAIVDIRPQWVAARIDTFRLNAPDGTAVDLNLGGHGHVLHRRLFDADLATMACEAGAHLLTRARATGLLRRDGAVTGVTFEHHGEPRSVEAAIVAGADGVESRVGVWAGIDTTTHVRDMESCAQFTLAGVDVAPTTCDFYFGTTVAPEGYVWIFPKGGSTANVGIGISALAARRRSALSLLREFVGSRMPDAGMVTMVAGGVPCARTLDHIVQDNVLLVGDAAHQVNPLSGGGITSGMRASVVAAENVTRALSSGRVRDMRRYERDWDDLLGAQHRMYHRIKTAVHRFPDATLDTIAAGLAALPADKRTIWNVLRIALVKHPGLIIDMIRMFNLAD